MTVKEALTAAGITPDASYAGVETADDMVLGIKTEDSQQTPDLYTVVQEHVTEHSGAINASTTDTAYIRTGSVTTKTGAQRQITINGERFVGDAFQDFALGLKMLFATGQDAVVNYVYFSLRTGKGESGKAVLVVSSDAGNAANNPASFSAQLNAVGKPEEYTYTDAVQADAQTAALLADDQSADALSAETPAAAKKAAS